MPNRWLKADLLTSERFNRASLIAQSVYVRLLLIADDHGCYDGRVPVILSACDPLQTFARNCPQVSADGLQEWFKGVLAELEELDLVRFWQSVKGPLLLIPRFYERARSKPRFGLPPDELLTDHGCTQLLADARKCALSTSTSTSTSTTHDHGCDEGAPRPRAPRKPKADRGPTAPTWDAYTEAYLRRYKQPPARNSRVNGQMAKFCALVPLEEAPHIAAFYVRHNKGYYVSRGHAVGLLYSDAEALRTQWLNGRGVTDTEARQADRSAATGNVFHELIEEARNGRH